MEFHIQELSLTVMLHIRSYIPQVNSSNLCSIIDNPETFFYVFSIELWETHFSSILKTLWPFLIHSPFSHHLILLEAT